MKYGERTYFPFISLEAYYNPTRKGQGDHYYIVIAPEEQGDMPSFYREETITPTCAEYRTWLEEKKELYTFSHGYALYDAQAIRIDPHFFGTWLGDGTRLTAGISTIDAETVEMVRAEAERLGMRVRQDDITYNIVSVNGAEDNERTPPFIYTVRPRKDAPAAVDAIHNAKGSSHRKRRAEEVAGGKRKGFEPRNYKQAQLHPGSSTTALDLAAVGDSDSENKVPLAPANPFLPAPATDGMDVLPPLPTQTPPEQLLAQLYSSKPRRGLQLRDGDTL